MTKIEQQRTAPRKKRRKKGRSTVRNVGSSNGRQRQPSSASKKTRNKKKSISQKRTLREMLRSFANGSTAMLILLIILLGCFFWNFSAHRVDGISMEPTFQENDRILLKKRQVVKRYEIITFQPKGVENTSYIKRVIGIPGDYIWVDGNSLFLLPEGGTERRAEAPTSSGDMLDNMLKITISDATAEELSQYKMIPKNQYFVQGDNRSHSNDSRDFGLVNSEQIEGVVCYRYFPFNKLGIPH